MLNECTPSLKAKSGTSYKRTSRLYVSDRMERHVHAELMDEWMHIRHMYRQLALFNSETSVSIQKRHPYTGNLNSETSGDSKNACLHCGDVLALSTCFMPATGGAVMQAAGQTHLWSWHAGDKGLWQVCCHQECQLPPGPLAAVHSKFKLPQGLLPSDDAVLFSMPKSIFS